VRVREGNPNFGHFIHFLGYFLRVLVVAPEMRSGGRQVRGSLGKYLAKIAKSEIIWKNGHNYLDFVNFRKYVKINGKLVNYLKM